MQALQATQGVHPGSVRPVPASAGGVGEGLVAVVRLLAAAVLLGSVLLLVALVGQARAGAQELAPASARTPGDAGTEPLTEDDATARLVQAQRMFTAAQTNDSATGQGGPDTPTSPGVPPPAWGQVPLPQTRFQVLAAADLNGRDEDGHPTPQAGSMTAVATAEAQPQALPATRPPTTPTSGVSVQASGLRTLMHAQTLLRETQQRTATTSVTHPIIVPPPEVLPERLVEQIRQHAAVAGWQATRNPEVARTELLGAAAKLGKLAEWSDSATPVLYKEAVRRNLETAINRFHDQSADYWDTWAKAGAWLAWTGKIYPLRKESVDAWNFAADLRMRLNDPDAPAPVSDLNPYWPRETPILPPKPPTPAQRDSLSAPESPEGTQLAGAESEQATPPDQGGAGGAAAGWDASLGQTPLEQTAAPTPPTEHDTSLSSSTISGSPVGSPLGNGPLVTVEVTDQTGAGGSGSDTSGASSSVAANLDAGLDAGNLDPSGSLSV
jgi:hypothetical protein